MPLPLDAALVRGDRFRNTMLMSAAVVAMAACHAAAPVPEPATAMGGLSREGLWYSASGPAGAPVVVLIHASSLDSRMWGAQVAALSSRYRVITYDTRGHGRSMVRATPYRAGDDLHGLLEELGVRRATIVGLSSGARIAVDFALAWPDATDGLVLVSPTVGGYEAAERPAWSTPIAAAVRARDGVRASSLMVNTPLMRVPDNPQAQAFVRRLVMDNDRVWTDTTDRELPLSPPALSRLGEIGARTLVIDGDADLPDVRRVADLLEARVRGAQRITIHDGVHLLPIQHPRQINRALLAFLGASADH